MIHAITNTIKVKLDTLAWTERTAGLVVPATKYSAEGNAEFVFPITSDMNAVDCVQQGKYWDVVPNSAYKGALYVEQLSAVRFAGFEKKYTWMNFTVDLRVVGWVNLAKLGYTDPAKSGLFSMSVIAKLLEDRGVMDVDDPDYAGAKIYVEIIGEAEKNNSIFSRYTYQRFSHFLIYPFDYFAVDLRCRLLVSSACVTAVADEGEVCEDVSINGD